MPSADAQITNVPRAASEFAAMLREGGINVGTFDLLTYINALAAIGIQNSQSTYWAGRISLLKNPVEIPAYDRVFKTYWLGSADSFGEADETKEEGAADDNDEMDKNMGGKPSLELADLETDTSLHQSIRYSPAETLSEKDFGKCSPEELLEAKKAISKIRLAIPERLGRRLQAGKSQTARLNMRQLARKAIQTQGETLRRAYLERKKTKRRLVLILDISGSMEVYSRLLLRFAHSARASFNRAEVFVLSTRLTRITRELASSNPDAALSKVSGAVEDWSGGTRLGEGIKTFNNKWGMRGMARGAVVIISSDGWDRGSPEVLTEQMERLHRAAHRVIWMNPLKASSGYEPLAQGMAAALPFVDDFVEGHSILSLEQLADLVGETECQNRKIREKK